VTGPTHPTRLPRNNRAYRTTGFGGVFLRARDASQLVRWYRRHLRLPVQSFGGVTFFRDRKREGRVAGNTTWAIFP